MKKVKNVISIAMSAILIFTLCFIPTVYAENIFPESDHDYANNYYNEWIYAYGGYAPYGLMVTFSEDTYTDTGSDWNFLLNIDDCTADEFLKLWNNSRTGDLISIFDESDELVGTYQGSELAGNTIFVSGSSVKITLITDNEETAYGFKVVDISPVTVANNRTVLRYHMPDGTVETDTVGRYYLGGIEASLASYKNAIYGNEAIIGWTRTENGKNPCYIPYDFNNGGIFNTDFPNFESGVLYDLYAETTPVGLSSDDVYSFTNSSYYFDVDGTDTYYLTKEDYCRYVSSACAAAGVGPMGLAAVVGTPILAAYKTWNWQGSCIGFANTVCLQKKGILDVVSMQKGASCVGDLEPTEDIVSMLNYYNGQSVTSLLCKNKALLAAPKEYSRQLKNVCDSLRNGNIVLFELLPDIDLTDLDAVTLEYHGIVLTGIYEASDGGFILLYYDENSYSYSDGYCQQLYVTADYSEIHGRFGNYNFFWTDEFECYKAVDINNDYPITGSFIYNIELLKHIVNFIIGVFKSYILRIA